MFWVLLFLITPMSFALEPEQTAVIQRIQPLGSVFIEGEKGSSSSPSVAAPAKKIARTGEAIFKQYCTVCHSTGVAGAPKFRDAQDWHDRLARQGIKDLISHVMKGYNAMPPMGTCQDCSSEDFKHAIEYMLPK